ncbi:hypothetical protein [Nocardia alni]|uniref:hypothetical protein n=1 Tax=Nocardia alni TaxID=2815723 RepID=UPI001C234058|nr:hypothetical protein [Nocardia alni]
MSVRPQPNPNIDSHDDARDPARLQGLFGLTDRNLSRPSARTTFSSEFVADTIVFVDGSGLVERIERWRAEDDRQSPGRGGRPTLLPGRDRVVLTLLLMLALNDEPLLVSRMTEILRYRLESESLRLLGLDPQQWRSAGTAVRDRLYFVVWRAFHRLLDVIDPAPGTPGRRLPLAQVQAIRAARDPEACVTKQKRAQWVANQFLQASYLLIPEPDRRQWLGDICVDATPVPVWGKKGTSSRTTRDPHARCSPDIDAGWYTREGDHRDTTAGRDPKTVWAYEATYAVMAADNPGTRPGYPLLVLSMTLDAPGQRVAENAVTCVASLRDRGLPGRYMVGDRAYFPNSRPEKLQLVARAMGYELVFDYRRDQLGVMTSRHGAIQVEGNWYCPAMPRGLIEATTDLRDERIDIGMYRQRIGRRHDYLLTPKARADKDGYRPMRCPAAGPAPTVSCPVKPRDAVSGKDLPTVLNPPNPSPKICANRESVTFGPADGAKYGQALQYGTDAWHARYATARNTVEGFNGFVKDPAYGSLAEAGRRRIRGYTAQLLSVALLTVSANIRKIRAYLARQHKPAPQSLSPIDRRRHTDSLTTYQPARDTSPMIGPAARHTDPCRPD